MRSKFRVLCCLSVWVQRFRVNRKHASPPGQQAVRQSDAINRIRQNEMGRRLRRPISVMRLKPNRYRVAATAFLNSAYISRTWAFLWLVRYSTPTLRIASI